MLKKTLVSASLLMAALTCTAEPFVNTDDLALRASLQKLAAAGQLNIPLTTYPLMWADISRGLNQLDPLKLEKHTANAYFHVKAELKKAKRSTSELQINTANKDQRFTSFGDTFRDKNSLTLANANNSGNFAYKLSSTFVASPDDENKVRFDDSYLAYKMGNWHISLSTQDRWWGPGWDTSLALTNNSRPVPSLVLSRNSSSPLTVPFTDYQVPWSLTTFMGRMERERTIPNTLLWGMRINFMPIEGLDIGLVRLAQWGGSGRSQSLGTFWNVLIGADNCGAEGRGGIDCGENNENEPGNQQAGYDIRYSFNLLETPLSIYAQYYGEDGKADSNITLISEPAIQAGIDGHFTLFNNSVTAFLEFTNSFQDCGKDKNIGNCFYEHHIYKTGMRYKGHNIGDIYDNDARSHVIGLVGHNNSIDWDVKLRYLELNYDNLDRHPADEKLGNTVTKVAEDMVMLSGNYQKNYRRFSYKIGASLARSIFDNPELSNKTSANINLEFNFLFN